MNSDNESLTNPVDAAAGDSTAKATRMLETLKDEPEAIATKAKRVRKKKARKTEGPRRPLTAYNIFFREAREKLLKEQENGEMEETDESLFSYLGKTIAKRWKELSPEALEDYQRRASADKERYNKELAKYKKDMVDTYTAKIEQRREQQREIASLTSSVAAAPASSMQHMSNNLHGMFFPAAQLAHAFPHMYMDPRTAFLPMSSFGEHPMPMQQQPVQGEWPWEMPQPSGHPPQRTVVEEYLRLTSRMGIIDQTSAAAYAAALPINQEILRLVPRQALPPASANSRDSIGLNEMAPLGDGPQLKEGTDDES